MNGEGLVFIGGVPRSGTSMLQIILGRHKNIYAGPEFDKLKSITDLHIDFTDNIANGRQKEYFDKERVRESFQKLIYNLLVSKRTEENVDILCEKTPQNVIVFEELQYLMPDAKFIWVVRDPRGCLNSFHSVYEKRRHIYKNEKSIGSDIINDLDLMNNYLRKGSLFYKNGENKNCIKVHYEDIVSEPEKTIRYITEFIGVTYNSDMLIPDNKSTVLNDKVGTVKSDLGFITESLGEKPQKSFANKWKNELRFSSQMILENYFSKENIPELKVYRINRRLNKLKMLKYLLKEKNIKWIFKTWLRR